MMSHHRDETGCDAPMSSAAFMPCPVIYGFVIDSTCVLWDRQCGKQTSCLYYDLDRFRHRPVSVFQHTLRILPLGSFRLSLPTLTRWASKVTKGQTHYTDSYLKALQCKNEWSVNLSTRHLLMVFFFGLCRFLGVQGVFMCGGLLCFCLTSLVLHRRRGAGPAGPQAANQSAYELVSERGKEKEVNPGHT